MKMTSAYANKLLKKLMEEKEYWRSYEADCCTYVASVDETPIVPDYDYRKVSEKIEELDCKIVAIKHAINVSNATNTITFGDTAMTVDMVLVRMAQLNKRKAILDAMRKRQPKSRIESGYGSRGAAPEYQYINYDLELVRREYDRIDTLIGEMQLALDKYNQTVEFEAEI